MPRATPLSCAGRPVLALAMALALALPCRAGDVIRVDVLVYGANSAGVGAAVTAAAGGKYKVQVMEPLEMIGGMGAAGGVALMNQGCGLEGVTGLAKNWSLLCGEYYYGTDNPHMVMFPSMNVSEWAFWRLLNSTASISTSVGCRVAAVAKADTGGCVGRVDFLCDNDTRPVSVLATYVIDASYDGDIMVMAGGIDHTHGREGRSVYNESLAGVNLAQPGESFVKDRLDIDPYFPNGTLLPYIDREPLAAPGTGDDKVMAYEYFACVSNTPGNQVPFYAPEGYNADDFTLLLRQTEGVMANGMYPHGPPLDYFGGIQCYDQIVQETTGNRDCLVCCGQGPVDSDQPDLNHGWPTANHSRRQQLRQAHRYYTQGSLYFLANDPRVPNATRESARGYGYCKDEYVKYGNFPPQLYIRISNRLQGKSLLTQNNIANPRVKPDGVAMGCWTFDQHTMSRHAVQDPKNSSRTVVRNEGYFRAPLEGPTRADGRPLGCEEGAECWSGVNWYDVPFGVMVPKDGQASNLLIPVVISTSSVAYASARIENMFMDLGSAAGVAVAQLLQREPVASGTCPTAAVQSTNITAVQRVLVDQYAQRVHGPPSKPPAPGPSSYTVVGAGSPAWNGAYNFTGRFTDERPIFEMEVNASHSMYSYDGIWRLAVEGKEIFYVTAEKTVGPEPPLTGWAVANATAPAPHLVAGPSRR